MRVVFTIFLLIWIGVLLIRSSLYITRIFQEFSSPQQVFSPEITVCSPTPSEILTEQFHLSNYRHYGVRCVQ